MKVIINVHVVPVSLHVEEHGNGPAIVLLHGFAGSARNFRPQVRALSNRYRAVCFDARGHARSEAPEEEKAYEREAFVSDIDRVIDRTKQDRVVLSGLSMGAALALEYALLHSDRLSGLALAAFPPPGDASPDGYASRFARAIEEHGLERAGEMFVWGGGRFDARSAALIRQGFLEHAPHALAHILRRVIARQPSVEELAPDLDRLALPTRIIVGTTDTPSISPSRELASRIHGARLVEVEGAGHVVNLQNQQLFNEVLLDLLSEVEVSSAVS